MSFFFFFFKLNSYKQYDEVYLNSVALFCFMLGKLCTKISTISKFVFTLPTVFRMDFLSTADGFMVLVSICLLLNVHHSVLTLTVYL